MLKIRNMGILEYESWLQLQEQYWQARAQNENGDTLFLLEHYPVFTIGRSTDLANDLPKDFLEVESRLRGIPVVRVGRGGGAMVHNPGQVVGYPLLKLTPNRLILRTLIDLVEETIIQVLLQFDIKAFRKPEIHPGVWTERGKIGFIGVAVRQGILLHGFAVNVNNDLEPFNWIAPCGLKSSPITSVSSCLRQKVDTIRFRQAIGEVFSGLWQKASSSSTNS
ncbi:MAG: lipoyl(octanoyl) transferase LipB [Candidatus Sumerlaeia bacterium]|nr:lipoyl(octanoyl) transferase LipB [Candidatus Sumerlaeia bacterium]